MSLEEMSYKPTKTLLQRIIAKYDERTAEVTTEMAMEMMDTNETNHFLMLLQIADYYPMGKSLSILYAYKLGYLEGKAGAET